MKTKKEPMETKFRVVSGDALTKVTLKYGRYVLAKCHPSCEPQLARIAAMWNAQGAEITDKTKLKERLNAEFGSELLQQCEIPLS